MEELRSTQILDKEIQGDARKKAEKIILAAKGECEKILNSTAEKIESAKQEKLSKYEEKLRLFEKDQEASMPLDKQRFLVNFIQNSINKAFDEYLESLSEDEKIQLVTKSLSKFEKNLKGKKVNAYVYGFSEKSVEKSLSKKIELSSVSKTEFNKMIIENSFGITNKMGIILEPEDKSVRIRLTLSEVVSQIQNRYRVELYDSLFNREVEQ